MDVSKNLLADFSFSSFYVFIFDYIALESRLIDMGVTIVIEFLVAT